MQNDAEVCTCCGSGKVFISDFFGDPYCYSCYTTPRDVDNDWKAEEQQFRRGRNERREFYRRFRR